MAPSFLLASPLLTLLQACFLRSWRCGTAWPIIAGFLHGARCLFLRLFLCQFPHLSLPLCGPKAISLEFRVPRLKRVILVVALS